VANPEPEFPPPAGRFHGANAPRRARPSFDPDRTADPGELVAQVTPCFAAAGITRVAEVTALDRIGIPVAIAVRPNSRSLSVSQGKGLSRDQAIASAVMEALELAAAERLPASLQRGTLSEIGARAASRGHAVFDMNTSTRCRLDRVRPDESLYWIEGHELSSGQPVIVPWALVGIDYREAPEGFHTAFQVSTDGLASGCTVDEAILHGLCELVERDATALLGFIPSDELSRRIYAVDLEDGAEVFGLRQMIEAAGCRLTVIDMTSDIDVSAFTAIISDAAGDGALVARYAHSGGSGCHPSRALALKKAIVEAAQSRITRITGSRDDLPASTYAEAEGEEQRSIAGLLSFADRADPTARKGAAGAAASPTESVTSILGDLGRRGIRNVVVVPIPNDFGISVMRVIVPGLQTELTGTRSKLGRRALIRLFGRLH